MGRNSGKTTALDNSTTNALKRKTRNLLSFREFHIAPPGLEPKAEPQHKGPTPARRAFRLPLLGSNQDSPDPESGVLPVTPRGIRRGIN